MEPIQEQLTTSSQVGSQARLSLSHVYSSSAYRGGGGEWAVSQPVAVAVSGVVASLLCGVC